MAEGARPFDGRRYVKSLEQRIRALELRAPKAGPSAAWTPFTNLRPGVVSPAADPAVFSMEGKLLRLAGRLELGSSFNRFNALCNVPGAAPGTTPGYDEVRTHAVLHHAFPHTVRGELVYVQLSGSGAGALSVTPTPAGDPPSDYFSPSVLYLNGASILVNS